MTTKGEWFRDVLGQRFRIVSLDRSMALSHLDWIVKTHNQIPFQLWNRKDVLAEKDENREYLGKWELSKIALSEEDSPLAFCIGFERKADNKYYHEPGIYLHRLAVTSEAQGRMIGMLLQTDTIAQAFIRGLRYVGSPKDPVIVFGQTNKVTENRAVLRFHSGTGFRVVGEKQYPDRVDVIMRMEAADFWSSHHLGRWRVQREDEASR